MKEKQIVSISIEEIRDNWKREWCEKYNVPYESYNPMFYRRIPKSKNEKYINRLIREGLDNNTINKRLERYRKIKIYQKSLNEMRKGMIKKQEKHKKTLVSQFIREGLNNELIRKELILIATKLPDELINELRKKVKSLQAHNKRYEDVAMKVINLQQDLDDITILYQELEKFDTCICPFCCNLVDFKSLENIRASKKVEMERFKRKRTELAKEKWRG